MIIDLIRILPAMRDCRGEVSRSTHYQPMTVENLRYVNFKEWRRGKSVSF